MHGGVGRSCAHAQWVGGMREGCGAPPHPIFGSGRLQGGWLDPKWGAGGSHSCGFTHTCAGDGAHCIVSVGTHTCAVARAHVILAHEKKNLSHH